MAGLRKFYWLPILRVTLAAMKLPCNLGYMLHRKLVFRSRLWRLNSVFTRRDTDIHTGLKSLPSPPTSG